MYWLERSGLPRSDDSLEFPDDCWVEALKELLGFLPRLRQDPANVIQELVGTHSFGLWNLSLVLSREDLLPQLRKISLLPSFLEELDQFLQLLQPLAAEGPVELFLACLVETPQPMTAEDQGLLRTREGRLQRRVAEAETNPREVLRA